MGLPVGKVLGLSEAAVISGNVVGLPEEDKDELISVGGALRKVVGGAVSNEVGLLEGAAVMGNVDGLSETGCALWMTLGVSVVIPEGLLVETSTSTTEGLTDTA